MQYHELLLRPPPAARACSLSTVVDLPAVCRALRGAPRVLPLFLYFRKPTGAMELLPMLKGLATFVPFAYAHHVAHRTIGNAWSARYCYAVWLRHLTALPRRLLPAVPRVVAELGPGDSLGVGLAALLSGASTYYAFDVVRYASSERNLKVLEELLALFDRRADIPDDTEFPRLKPRLASYRFPSDLLTDDRISRALAPARLHAIRESLRSPERHTDGITISYVVPWHGMDRIRPGSVDLILSQAVLEHVNDLHGAYRAMYRWLRDGGIMSHEIDYRCHDITRHWNGHWTYPAWAWQIVSGARPYFLNRTAHSAHVRMMQEAGLDVVTELCERRTDGVERMACAGMFRDLCDDDFSTSGGFLQAVKRPEPAAHPAAPGN